VIWRVRHRHEFERVRRDGVRIRPESGDQFVNRALWSQVIVEPVGTPPRLGFAIGRPVGGAVVRNRLRRRLRAAFATLADGGDMVPGRYVVGASPSAAELTFEQLSTAAASICEQAARLVPVGTVAAAGNGEAP
jgi:ribonuclease P protein component